MTEVLASGRCRGPHWFAYYGQVGTSSPVCVRPLCDAINPRYDPERDPRRPDFGDILAFVVEPGYLACENIAGRNNADLLTYSDGTVRFRHHCDRGARGTIVCAPALRIGPHGSGHSLTRDGDGLPTVEPSILCPDCGTHGWVRRGLWEAA